jgi:hypothetical protein
VPLDSYGDGLIAPLALDPFTVLSHLTTIQWILCSSGMTRGLYPLWMVDKLLGKLDFADPGEEASPPFSTTGIAEITKITRQWLSASLSLSERTFSRLFWLFPYTCNNPKDPTQVYCLRCITDLGYSNIYLQCLSHSI